jgi:Flp pilus assembly CpaE family ATPase
MATLVVTSARGGSGASLLATNLGVALAGGGTCLLLDLHGPDAIDDLLLDLEPTHSWTDLLPIAETLDETHLARATSRHASGLRLLAGGVPTDDLRVEPQVLLRSLTFHAAWLVVDSPSGLSTDGLLGFADLVLLVTLPDPPSLRTTRRWLLHLPTATRRKVGLVVNQAAAGQPLLAQGAAHALDLPLSAWLPADSAAIGRQVHFGEAAVLDAGSCYGRAVRQLAGRLLSSRALLLRKGEADRSKVKAVERPA